MFAFCINKVLIFIPSISTYKTKLYLMYTFCEIVLPILFIGLVTYFIGSICRLFIHLLISESCK